jgi:quercetin dioxygenase-like cupin family protein
MNLITRSMNRLRTLATISVALFSVPAGPATQAQSVPHAAKPRARVAFAHTLPTLDGNKLKATVVEVNYGPGEWSRSHSHPCAVIGYVVQGTIRTQVKGQPEALVHAGESFYEPPNGVHLVSANASQTAPAGFLAFFVCDRDSPLSTDVKPVAEPGGK